MFAEDVFGALATDDGPAEHDVLSWKTALKSYQCETVSIGCSRTMRQKCCDGRRRECSRTIFSVEERVGRVRSGEMYVSPSLHIDTSVVSAVAHISGLAKMPGVNGAVYLAFHAGWMAACWLEYTI